MPYLIDGHNLIPKIPGLSLRAVEDERDLIEMLVEFCRRQRKRVEVFFDNAPPGQPRARNFGLLVARFVREGITADQAIQNRLERLGNTARNWTVVSSDGEVQASARRARARYLSSEVFAQQLLQTLNEQSGETSKDADAHLEPGEIDDWLAIFGADEGEPDETG